MTRGEAVRLAAAAQVAGKVVVVGGPDAAGYPDAYLQHGADVVVFGEGEAAAADLLVRLGTGGSHDLAAVDGIAYRNQDGIVVRTTPRTPIDDLARVPWPDRESVSIEDYLACWRTHHGEGSVSLITARGCPYRCKWCSHAVYGYTHRRRPAADVADEVVHIKERYAPELLWFADDVFSISYRWLREYAHEVRRRDCALPFETITRADRVTDEVVAWMAELGCKRVWLGSESGSQRILDAMERGVTVEQISWAVKTFQAAGIEVGLFLMWGYEGEDASDIEATIRHVVRASPDRFLTTVAYPIRGTPYFDDVRERMSTPEDWLTSSDRDHRVRGRPSSKYYSFATDRLRAEVALHASTGRPLSSNAPVAAKATLALARARFGMWRTRNETELPLHGPPT
jgi:radical SAM superfamily enzyme YgiQ (UPF0313 family)